ncbi:hypothetical protein AB0D14_41885, partial [Streptomyces sp. NPDC048484]|uniref:hypothetical protein n=1 Tax=Streptomyces sp. NPDC048484 TaxID=3155146 RepID=UPI0034182AB9
METLSTAIGKSKVDGATAGTVARIRRADLTVIDLCRDRDYAEKAAGKRDRGLRGGCCARHSRRRV